ncbi:MAG: ADP-ribosylglycohydrolase family protein [Planctomycetes bacterium]|nr:ADP-ribosylglycohydrolase family protein [Planctomycetota bacterium]
MAISLEDRFAGSLLGLALGDALGAKHEGGPLEQAAWWLMGIGKGELLRWTDDTQMAIALAESLITRRGLDPDHLARLWAERADWERGYGTGARKLLRMIRDGADWREANRAIFPDGSFGNGAAMRAAPLGLFFHTDLAALARAAELASSITHAHPLGIEGGVLIARATAMALAGPLDLDLLARDSSSDEYRSRLTTASGWGEEPTPPAIVRRALGAWVEAHESAVTAVYLARRFDGSFQEMVKFAIRLGGDTDTIAAMAGGILGARHGAGFLPGEFLARIEAREEIERLARDLFRASSRTAC